MKKVRFIWSGVDKRTISAADFKSVGVDDQHQVEFSTTVPGQDVQEVSDAAAKHLVENDVQPNNEGGFMPSFEYVEDDGDTTDADASTETEVDDKTKEAEAAGTESASTSVPAEGDTGSGSSKSSKGSARP